MSTRLSSGQAKRWRPNLGEVSTCQGARFSAATFKTGEGGEQIKLGYWKLLEISLQLRQLLNASQRTINFFFACLNGQANGQGTPLAWKADLSMWQQSTVQPLPLKQTCNLIQLLYTFAQLEKKESTSEAGVQVYKSIVQGKYVELRKGMNHLVKILAFRDIHWVEKKCKRGWAIGEIEHSTQPVFEKGLVLQVFQNKPAGIECYRNSGSTSGSLCLSTGTNVATNMHVCVREKEKQTSEWSISFLRATIRSLYILAKLELLSIVMYRYSSPLHITPSLVLNMTNMEYWHTI